MADAAAATLQSISALQTALTVVHTLALTAYHYPANCTSYGASYDFIIVGGGTAGSTLANRLSANSNISVLLLEAGGYQPLESEFPGLFTALPRSVYDYDFYSENDNYTAQNLQNGKVGLTQGKMLSGSSGLHHMIHVQGDPNDFSQWAKITGDDNWRYENVLPFFKKLENLTDPGLLASEFANLHGTDGLLKISREINPSSINYMNSYAEMGYKVVNDTTSKVSTLGFTYPLFTIDDDIRQSGAYGYLGPIKERPNLCVALSATAEKIIIKDGAAVGVQVATVGGDTYTVNANKEVLVSAGAINTPKLLMLSGIGPKEHLESKDIEVVVDLPVGQNFMDHPSAILFYQMEESDAPAPAVNPRVFPVPTTVGYVALNESQSYPDYQVINLEFPHDSDALLQLCSNVFKYSNDICNKFYAASSGRNTLFVVHNLMMPKSRGQILLASNNPADDPLIYTGTFSDTSDLELMGASLADFNRILDTSYFKSVNASLVDTGLCKDKQTDEEFWQCYALEMSATMWHYAGTCSMGKVVDSTLRVKGLKKLRVVDASVMPTQVSGNINAAVGMIAERAADLIIKSIYLRN